MARSVRVAMNEAEQLTLTAALRMGDCDCICHTDPLASASGGCCEEQHKDGSGKVPVFPRLRVECRCKGSGKDFQAKPGGAALAGAWYEIEDTDKPCPECGGRTWKPEPDKYRAYGIIREVLDSKAIDTLLWVAVKEIQDGSTG